MSKLQSQKEPRTCCPKAAICVYFSRKHFCRNGVDPVQTAICQPLTMLKHTTNQPNTGTGKQTNKQSNTQTNKHPFSVFCCVCSVKVGDGWFACAPHMNNPNVDMSPIAWCLSSMSSLTVPSIINHHPIANCQVQSQHRIGAGVCVCVFCVI